VRQVRGFHRRSGWRISAGGDYDTPKLMLEFEDCWGQCQQPSPDIEVGGWATEVREEEGRERQGRRGGRISEIKRLRKEEQERKKGNGSCSLSMTQPVLIGVSLIQSPITQGTLGNSCRQQALMCVPCSSESEICSSVGPSLTELSACYSLRVVIQA
jgi:hypothetical protein